MYIGVDVGTSAVKALLVDDDEHVLASSEQPLTRDAPKPLWSEQHPAHWCEATRDALRGLRAAAPAPFGATRSIGLSGQMHGAVCLDSSGSPLRPAILWNDGRSTAECAQLNGGDVDVGTLAGVPAMPGFTAPKLMWLRQHEPEVFEQVAHVVLPKDYVRLELTGELATDVSDAAGTLWLDQAQRAWSETLLDASGMRAAQMPRVLEGTQASGTLRAGVAAELGLPRGVVVAAGAGDAAAGAVGIGAVADGDAFVSLGTSGQVFASRDAHCPRPERLVHAFAHCVPARWFQMACMLNGASCLAWAAKLLREQDIGALLARVEAAYSGPGNVLFLPYLTGERTPHDDALARGVLIGLTPETGSCEVVQAVLEGVAYSVRECDGCLGLDSPLRAIGGGARSRFWLQLIADVLGRPVHALTGGDTGPAFGAARLARIAVTGEPVNGVVRQPASAAEFVPHGERHADYAERYEQFRSAYCLLKNTFAAQHAAAAPDPT